jgi:hypothetical protein
VFAKNPPPPFWMFEEAGENSRIGNQELGIENWEFENLHTYRFSKCLVPLLKGPKEINFSGCGFLGILNEAKKILASVYYMIQ